jgi:hypothetical protein
MIESENPGHQPFGWKVVGKDAFEKSRASEARKGPFGSKVVDEAPPPAPAGPQDAGELLLGEIDVPERVESAAADLAPSSTGPDGAVVTPTVRVAEALSFSVAAVVEALKASPAHLDTLIAAELHRPDGPRIGAFRAFIQTEQGNLRRAPVLQALERKLAELQGG